MLEPEQVQQLIQYNQELLHAVGQHRNNPNQGTMALAPDVLNALTRLGKTSIQIGDLPIYQADPTESLLTFFDRFEHIAEFNRWTDEDRARTLPLCLRQQVLTF